MVHQKCNQIWKLTAMTILVLVAAALTVSAHQHGHHHHHHDHDHEHTEPASFKYSRAANTPEGTKVKAPASHQEAHSKATKPAGTLSKKSRSFEDTVSLWLRAIGSNLLISIAPFLILFLIPIDNRSGHESFLKILLSFASGGLLGDAFLHLIPHAMAPHSHDGEEHGHGHSHEHHHGHSHEHGHGGHDLSVGLWVLAGIMTFLMVEKFVRMVKGGHSHGHGHSHEQGHHSNEEEKKDDVFSSHGKADGEVVNAEGSERAASLRKRRSLTSSKETENCDSSQDDKEKKLSGKSDADEPTTEKEKKLRPESKCSKNMDKGSTSSDGSTQDIKVAAYLNLAADFTHNFTDGLAIGASYIAGNAAGVISTVTILLHEVPHEIGDFAILIQSGYTKRKAMMMQLVTALGCLSGTLCSLIAEGMSSSANAWVLPFTAGGFIYIATVSVIPELLENSNFWQSVKEIIALVVGVLMMALLSEFE